jgi:outer membrane receptor protein involved in Fe transport
MGAAAALAVIALCSSVIARAADRPLVGLTLTEAISRLIADGLPVVYSSNVVRADMKVAVEPRAGTPRATLDELLAPHGLAVREMGSGRLVIVRAPPRAPRPAPVPAAALASTKAPLEELVVTGSRYEFERVADAGPFSMAAQEIERLPAIGDDPLRAVARLPGTATGGFTAKSNIRAARSTRRSFASTAFACTTRSNLKDFQSVFSTIDPALVRSIQVYTGGFPVAFGDRMSGVIDVETLDPSRSIFGSVA